MEKRNSRSHFKIELGVLKPKKSYETEKEALKIARFLNTQENIIHKMIAYKCSTCGKWHIGNNGSELTEEDRIYYRKRLQREKKWGL
jgi:DNA-directed RNA polymerase subunit RPC12/RpoP